MDPGAYENLHPDKSPTEPLKRNPPYWNWRQISAHLCGRCSFLSNQTLETLDPLETLGRTAWGPTSTVCSRVQCIPLSMNPSFYRFPSYRLEWPCKPSSDGHHHIPGWVPVSVRRSFQPVSPTPGTDSPIDSTQLSLASFTQSGVAFKNGSRMGLMMLVLL